MNLRKASLAVISCSRLWHCSVRVNLRTSRSCSLRERRTMHLLVLLLRIRVVSQASPHQKGISEARRGGRGKWGGLDTRGRRRRGGGEGEVEEKGSFRIKVWGGRENKYMKILQYKAVVLLKLKCQIIQVFVLRKRLLARSPWWSIINREWL